MQHGFSMPLVFGVTRAHCVAFAERAPVNAGSWGMAPGADGARSTSPSTLDPTSLDRLVQRVTSPRRLSAPHTRGRAGDRSASRDPRARGVPGLSRETVLRRTGGRDAARPVRPQGRSAGLPTRRRILRLRRAGSRTLPPRKVGSTRRAPVARFRRGRRSETRPSPGRARRYSSRIRRNTTPPHPSSRRAPRHAMPNLTLNGGSVQVARL